MRRRRYKVNTSRAPPMRGEDCGDMRSRDPRLTNQRPAWWPPGWRQAVLLSAGIRFIIGRKLSVIRVSVYYVVKCYLDMWHIAYSIYVNKVSSFTSVLLCRKRFWVRWRINISSDNLHCDTLLLREVGTPRFLSVITLGKRQACHVTTADKLQVVGGVCFVTLHSPSLSLMRGWE